MDQKLKVSDFIMIGVLSAVAVVLFFVLGSLIGSTPVGWLFTYAILAIPLGIVYMLMYSKVRKNYVVLISGLVICALMLMNFWLVPAFLICLFLPGAILFLHEKWYGQAIRLSVSFAVMITVQIALLHVPTANALTMILGVILFYGLRLFPIGMLFHWLVETTTISEWMKSMELMRMPKGFIITTATLLRYASSIS